MKKKFTVIVLSLLTMLLSACNYLRLDLMHPYIRSPYINSPEQEAAVLAKASLGWTADGRVRVLTLKGSPYEMGYQHGALLREEVQDNLGYLYAKAVDKFHGEEILEEVYERMRPYIPEDYVQEMAGLAHGSRLPLKVIHGVHALPELGEWGGKKQVKQVLDKFLSGEYATSCSNLCASGAATPDNNFFSVRILDWGLHKVSKLHKYPLLAVAYPDGKIPFVNIGWVGFLGAVSGMNAEGITLGEMGYGDSGNETLFGKTMPFMLRDVLSGAHNLADVRRIIQESPPTCSYVFLMSDGKTREAEMYVRDPARFLVFKAGVDIKDKKEYLPAIEETLYGGHFNEKMTELLKANHGKLTPELLMTDIIPKIAMKSNFQNVIYEPAKLRFWVSNAASASRWAASEPYTLFEWKPDAK